MSQSHHCCSLQIDLARLLPQHKWLFPSDGYLASEAGSPTAWRTLFKALGCTDFIQAPIAALQLTSEQKAASHWARADLGTPNASGKFAVLDRSAAEFTEVVQSLHEHNKKRNNLQIPCGHLLRYLESLWEDEYARYAYVQLGSQSGDPSNN